MEEELVHSDGRGGGQGVQDHEIARLLNMEEGDGESEAKEGEGSRKIDQGSRKIDQGSRKSRHGSRTIGTGTRSAGYPAKSSGKREKRVESDRKSGGDAKSEVDAALWSGSTKNTDVSTGPLARLFAHSLAPLPDSLAPPCLPSSRPPLRLLVGKGMIGCLKMT